MFSCASKLKYCRGVVTSILLYLLLTLFSVSGVSYAQDASTVSKDTSEAYSALLEVLEDDNARNQLISELKRVQSQNTTESTSDKHGIPDLDDDKHDAESTLQGQLINPAISEHIHNIGDKVKKDLNNSWWVLSQLVRGEKVPGVGFSQWKPAIHSLAIAMIAVVIAYLTLRLLVQRGFKHLDGWILRERNRSHAPKKHGKHEKLASLTTNERGRKLIAVLAALAIDLGASIIAAITAYVAVVAFSSPKATVSLFAIQFLTAFVFVEAGKAVVRSIFAIRYPSLRLLPIDEHSATFWSRWISAIINVTGYGLLLVVPVTRALLTTSVAQLLGLLLMIAVYIYAVRVVWLRRDTVKQGFIDLAENIEAAILGSLIRILSRIWHWLVIAYFTVLFVVSQTDQHEALTFMARATIQTLIAIVVGAALVAWITSITRRRVHLQGYLASSIPSLEARLNSYSTATLRGIRLLIVIVSILIIMDAWSAFNLANWLASPKGQAAISIVVRVSIILLIAAMSWTILASIIEHRLGVSDGKKPPSEREKTLLILFRNAAAITIATLTILIVLSHIGIDIGPLLAGAGVAGLAIGFGAQKLVQDVITGIFIQVENGMNQNDVVEIVGLFGTVEKITIRSVVLRTLDGGYHLIPFSAIDKVSNHTRDYGYHYGEYLVSHRESAADVIDHLKKAFDKLMQDPNLAPEVIEDISIPGVTSLNEKGFTVRVMIKTTAGNQWNIQRAYNRLVKEQFDQAGIEIPYPQTVIHFGRDKTGNAAPLDVRSIRKLEDAFDTRSAPGQTRRRAKTPELTKTPEFDANPSEPEET